MGHSEKVSNISDVHPMSCRGSAGTLWQELQSGYVDLRRAAVGLDLDLAKGSETSPIRQLVDLVAWWSASCVRVS